MVKEIKKKLTIKSEKVQWSINPATHVIGLQMYDYKWMI